MTAATQGRHTDPAITVSGLTKRFGRKTVVDGLTLTVPQGRIYGFLGPNGSGKTTTIRMLCGLLRPDGGRGTCLGYDIRRQAGAIKARVGYMTQRFSLYQDLTVTENLMLVARLFGVRHRRRAVAETVERLSLTARRHQIAGTLSGGWKQRVALAACLVHAPRLLLLDEPTAGVDPKARRAFWEEIRQFADCDGLTVLVSTHYMDEAERCDRIVYLLYGQVLAEGDVKGVVASAGLTAWAVEGPDLNGLATALREEPAVEQVAAFGQRLHITGRDAEALAQTVARYRDRDPALRWQPQAAGLEDVFIHLMAGVETEESPPA